LSLEEYACDLAQTVSSGTLSPPSKAEREELEAGRRRARRLEKRFAAERQEIKKQDVEGKKRERVLKKKQLVCL
jgi:hypothetical protein